MFEPDTATLYLASVTGRLSYLIVFLVVSLRQKQETYLWHWLGALFFSSVGSVLMMMVPIGEPPPFDIAVFAFPTFIASLVLAWTGLRRFYERKACWPQAALLVFAPVTLFIVLSGIASLPQWGTASVLAGCVLSICLTLREVIRSGGSDRLWSQYIVAAAFSFYLLVLVGALGMMATQDLGAVQSESGRYAMLVDQCAGVFIYFGFLAMAGERALLTVQRIAETDPLTGLANRRGLTARLAILRARRGSPQPLGIMIADIDHFKAINDRHGHATGDAVLKAFADKLRQALRSGDIAVRWGGEEFLTVLPLAQPDETRRIAERLRQLIGTSPFDTASGRIDVTVSIGISEMEAGATDLENAIRKADIALYKAKRTGRNRVCE